MNPIKLPQFRKTAQVTLAIALLNAASVDAVWANLTNKTIAFGITGQSVIQGIVKDQEGKPIDGGTIINETSKQSTRTEFNGKFNLKGQVGDQLRISSLGYKTVTILATDSPLEVVLEKDDSKLDEVVVTAIGIKQQKKQIGYATQEVKLDVLKESKTMNIGTAL